MSLPVQLPAELIMMLLGDARLPVAGHTQSAGLEPAVVAGLGAHEVPAYLRARLDTVVPVEAATGVVALHHWRSGLPIEPVCRAWAARTPSAALRQVSRTQGRAFARIATRLFPASAILGEVLASTTAGAGLPRPVVVAAAVAQTDVSPGSLARLIGYDDVQTVTSAALKLLPLDPAQVAAWSADALSSVAALAEEVAGLRSPDEIPASSAPQMELWAETHATTTRRLFSA